jgi:transglutaminase-like putative cysteine protease
MPMNSKKKFLADMRLKAVLSLLVALIPAPASAGHSFIVRPQPAWVQAVAFESEESDPSDSDSGMIFLLADRQTRVNGKSVERFYRSVKKITSAAGLEDLSQIEFDFDPSYQQLVIHHIRIHRGNQTIDALRPREISVIQQESQLDERLYNGTLSALAILNDVRVGDLIDYAYSIIGDNPIMGGRYLDSFYLAFTEQVEKIRFRLLWPDGRALHTHNENTDLQPAVRNLGNEIEYVWEQSDVKAIEFDDSTPLWFNPLPSIDLSEFASWQEVVLWALPLYRIEAPLTAELKKQIEAWRAESANPEGRLLAALRFVQDDIRYMGIELGPNSHRPTQPATVFDRRFGDCKDKSLLLCAVLNSLGIEAYPALANTSARHALDSWQPSPYAFNHVIVQAKVEGRTLWIDPTITLQRGNLNHRYNPDYARALVVREGVNRLEEIPLPSNDEPSISVKEVYTVSADQSSALLEVKTTYRAGDADAMRYLLSRQSLAELGKASLNRYAENDPLIRQEGLPQVSDDTETNTIVVAERYRMSSFWKDGKKEVLGSRIYEELSRPSLAQRTMPVGLNHPVHLSHAIEIRLPENLHVPEDSGFVVSDAIRFKYSCRSDGPVVRIEYEYRTLSDHVPAERAARHIQDIDDIGKVIGIAVWQKGRQPGGSSGSAVAVALSILLGPFVIFGAVKVVQRVRARRRLGEFKERLQVTPGETPETAIGLRGEEDLPQRMSAIRCSCGCTYYNQGDNIEREGCIFDGRRLIIVGLRCARCGNRRNFYFAPADA